MKCAKAGCVSLEYADVRNLGGEDLREELVTAKNQLVAIRKCLASLRISDEKLRRQVCGIAARHDKGRRFWADPYVLDLADIRAACGMVEMGFELKENGDGKA